MRKASALLLVLFAAGCASAAQPAQQQGILRKIPRTITVIGTVEPVTLSLDGGRGTRPGKPMCETNDPMVRAALAPRAGTMPHVGRVGPVVPMPNACPVLRIASLKSVGVSYPGKVERVPAAPQSPPAGPEAEPRP